MNTTFPETPLKRPPGRPATGRRFPHRLCAYVAQEDYELAQRLAAVLDGDRPRGLAAVMRRAFRLLAEQEAAGAAP